MPEFDPCADAWCGPWCPVPRSRWSAHAGSSSATRAGISIESEGPELSRSQEIRAAGRLAGDVLTGVVDTVHDVHRAVARRAFAAVGPAAAPVRVLHDGITNVVYGVVRGAHAALPRGAAVAAAAGAGLADQPPLSASPPAGLALAVLNGMWGDTLARRHPELALAMSLRAGGVDVPTTVGGLAAAYPAATSRIAVF